VINLKHTKNGNVLLALAVTAGNAAGNVVPLGSSGLRGILHTSRATTATIAAGTAGQGLADGEATVELIGINTVIDLAIAGAITQYAPVFATYAAGVATYDATGTHFVGWVLETLSGAGTAEVAIAASGGAFYAMGGIAVSDEVTGNGSAQNFAHGLGVTPSKVFVVFTDLTPATAGSAVVTEGTHTSTNAVVTVTSNKKYRVIAIR
jgi:hypothetical protein